MRSILLSFFFVSLLSESNAQLKFILEDFEGFFNGSSDMKANGVFTFGNGTAVIDYKAESPNNSEIFNYLGERYITVSNNGKYKFAGWGRGVVLNIDLDPSTDNLNFYMNLNKNGNDSLKILLQEDDNGDSQYRKEDDDEWAYSIDLKQNRSFEKGGWQLISIPLLKFKDNNTGGDGVFNCNYKNGKLLCFTVSFMNHHPLNDKQKTSFDFICFSKGDLTEHLNKKGESENVCSLGFWSKEGGTANFTGIAKEFERIFSPESEKKIGVIHFFQPFSVDGGTKQNHFPAVERINKVIEQGYIPMITLENHFVNASSKIKQPNLYSIVEGHMDLFFADWAKKIKLVEGTVLVRILHEFNGDWYPWCIVNNDKDASLFIKAYRHIHDIFKAQDVKNVKFIWCPNSMSVPQEGWNFIMDAYPGDAYVDYVGTDIYNGAGQKSSVWRSFRKEAIENYFLFTQNLPDKPLLVCETASRERESSESLCQTKEGWIKQLSEALKSDMSEIKLLTWFNEKSTFQINSSASSRNAFLNYILKDDYFKSGTKYLK
jgi:beta-mannanase